MLTFMTLAKIVMETIAYLYDCTLYCNAEYRSRLWLYLRLQWSGSLTLSAILSITILGTLKKVSDTLHYNLRYSHKGEQYFSVQS
jgi:hypothetical protein